MSTMSWWTTAQKCVDYIRNAGATTSIYIPGNGYSAASSWTDESVDTDQPPKRSNAYGWLNVNDGTPIFDPIGKPVAEVHVYLNSEGNGNGMTVVSATVARGRLELAMDEAAPEVIPCSSAKSASQRGYRRRTGRLGRL